MHLSIIIPVCNEESSIAEVCRKLCKTLNSLTQSYEILIIDDGSIDRTANEVRRLTTDQPRISILSLTKNYGKSEALQAGFDHAAGDIIITMDGDGQDDPRDIPPLLNHLSQGADAVFGWRHERRDPRLKIIAAQASNLFRRAFTGDTIHDVGCPLRAMTKECLNDILLSKGLHRYLSTILHKLGYTVTEVKVNHFPRMNGNSKYGLLDRLWEGLVDYVRISFLDIKQLMRRKSRYRIKPQPKSTAR